MSALLNLDIASFNILLSNQSTAYKIGFATGSFLRNYWPFLLAAVIIYLIYFFLKRRNKVKT